MLQVQFSRSWSQDFGTHDRRSQVQGFNSRVPLRSQVPGSWVPGSRVSGLRVSGLRSQGLESQGARSRVSGPDFRLCSRNGICL